MRGLKKLGNRCQGPKQWLLTLFGAAMDILEFKREFDAIFKSYREKYPQVSLNNISKRCGKANGTLRNLLDQENLSWPQPDTILNFMMVLLERKDIYEVIMEAPGVIGEYLRKSFPLYKNYPSKEIPQMQTHINDRESFLITWMCSTAQGMTRQEVKDIFGHLGLIRLDELISADALIVHEDGRIRTHDENTYVTPDIFRQYIGDIFKFIKFEDAGKGTNLMYSFVESVSEEYQKESVAKIYDLYREILRGSKDPQNKGNVKFFTVMAADSMTLQEGESR
jgi:hypothetical protein